MAVSHCSGFTSDGELHGAAEAAAVVGLFGMHVLGGASVVYDCHACWSFQLRIAAATCTPGGDKRAARGAVVFSAAKVANTEAASRCVSLAARPELLLVRPARANRNLRDVSDTVRVPDGANVHYK